MGDRPTAVKGMSGSVGRATRSSFRHHPSVTAPDFDLGGRVALVTGASSGIGEAIAVGLAAMGVKVGCVARRSDRLDAVVAGIGERGGVATAAPADVRDQAGLTAAVDAVADELGPPTLAVNSAGIADSNPGESMPLDQFQNLYDVNVRGVFLSCQAEARHMLAAGRGSIVNIASMSGTIANRGLLQAHYNSSKAAVIHMGRSLAWEWADRGVRVNTVSPGYTNTPMARRPEQVEKMAGYALDTPVRRNAEPEEIVGPVVFLLSDAASFVTGVDLLVDGGHTIW
jgi:NAD(P)-dependent dehydrogenase (short-subunit alcohol dehydrogenase family)